MGDSVAVSIYKGDAIQTVFTPTRKGEFFVENKLKPYQKCYQWVVYKGKFETDDNQLFVTLNSLDLKKRNKRRPIQLVLRKNSSAIQDGMVTGINNLKYADNTLSYGCSSNGNVSYRTEVYNASGTLVASLGTRANAGLYAQQQFTLDLPRGMYIVKIVSGSSSKSYKLITK
jgi:hypothetical protein